MIHALIGQKKIQTQRFRTDGTRIPVTEIHLTANPVISLKTSDKDGYNAVQLGFGTKKHPTKQLLGHIKGANRENAPHFLREVRVVDADMPSVGTLIKAADVFKPGDIIDVIGVSKGKGYAGGVKRWHFKGGPRTHGQSDRERAPGSIGQTTTPGRVYKGKHMAGHMGFDRVTVKNLEVVAVLDDAIWIKGLVPGGTNNLLYIKKVGEKVCTTFG
jgi:large subunit ribosomal protein L3